MKLIEMYLISLTYVIELIKPIPNPRNPNEKYIFAKLSDVANKYQPINGKKLEMSIARFRPNRSAINPDNTDPNGWKMNEILAKNKNMWCNTINK